MQVGKKLKVGDVVLIKWKFMYKNELRPTKYDGGIGVIDEVVDCPNAYWVEVGAKVHGKTYLFRDLLLLDGSSLKKIGTLN